MTDSLTILRATPTPAGAPRFATKRWIWSDALGEWRKISYDAGATFTAEERPVGSLADVAAVLEQARRDPTAFVVRGALLPETRAAVAADPGHRLRRAKKAGRNGRAPTLEEVPRHWLLIDIDSWPLPDWADLADDPEAAIEAAIAELLPECFRDVSCWWQLSASAGFKPGVLKVHLVFWLTEAISNEDLKLYLHVHAPAVDRAPYNAAQPHYIADPIIEGGHDPLPRRTGWVKGIEESVTLPALDLAALRGAIQQRRERAVTGAGLDAGAARTIAGALALLGDDPGQEGWHAPLRRATLLYARQTSQRNRDDEAVKAACRDAIHAANLREAGRHAASDIARFCSDSYLDALIDGAFQWVENNKADVPQGTAPAYAAPEHTVDAARDVLRERITEVLRDIAAWHAAPHGAKPRHVGLAVDTGGGKSRITREEVATFVATQRAAGLPYRVLWLVPTIKLGAEAEKHFDGMRGVTVAIHRGRAQPDPLAPGESMCMDLEAVKLAQSAGESIEKTVCGSSKNNVTHCPFFEVCGYQRQRTPVSKADVVIAAHEAGFRLPQGFHKKDVALVVFDESWWQDGIRTGRTIPVEGSADSVLAFPVWKHVNGGRQAQDLDGTDELHVIRTRLERALAKAPEGYLRRETLVAGGLTVADCARARNHEWNRRREGLMRPGMSRKDRQAAAEQAGVNALVPRFVAMWTVLADLLAGGAEATGRAEMLWRPDRDGTPRWTISLNTISELADAVTEAPILLLDATLPPDLVRAYLPRLETAEPVRVKAPFMEVRQVRGGWGKTTLLPGGMQVERDEEGQLVRPLPRLLAELRDFVAGQTRGERSLVITYKAAEAAFVGLPGVEVAHFNDVAGRDEWRDVRHLFVIGRPRPRSDHVRLDAAALTGEPVEVAESHRETRGVLMADGKGGTIEVRAYANPAAEAVSAAITDAEVIQAVGRGRGINRTADDPLRVWLMADVAAPLVVDELLDWRDLAPSAVERMACRGVLLASPGDAAAAYPDLFATPKAAEHALKRAGVGKGDLAPIPLRIYLLRELGGKSPLGFRYRPPGRGQQTRQGWAPPDMDPEDVLRWLEERVGPVALFDPDTPEPPEPDPRPPTAVPVSRSAELVDAGAMAASPEPPLPPDGGSQAVRTGFAEGFAPDLSRVRSDPAAPAPLEGIGTRDPQGSGADPPLRLSRKALPPPLPEGTGDTSENSDPLPPRPPGRPRSITAAEGRPP